MTEVENIADWRGKDLHDRDGRKIGKLQDVYVDTETDEPVFGSVKEGLIGRHLTFVPLHGATATPDGLTLVVSHKRVKQAPNLERDGILDPPAERALYEHYEIAYAPPATSGGRRLARL